jgi:hypothetical protein
VPRPGVGRAVRNRHRHAVELASSTVSTSAPDAIDAARKCCVSHMSFGLGTSRKFP